MKNKILNTLLAGAAIATMSAVSANAATLDAIEGEVKFVFDGFDSAQTSYDTSTPGTLCTTVAGCDAASISANAPGANQANDTWGTVNILSIDEVNSPAPVLEWTAGTDGDFLFAYFYGFNDTEVEVISAAETNIFSEGGHVAIYRVDAAFFGTLDRSNQAALEASLAGESLYLQLDFIAGCDSVVTDATLCGTFDLSNLLGASNGSAVATGGSAENKYPEEFQFEQSVEPCGVNVTCPAGSTLNLVVRSGSAVTTALPAPGALGLLGLGLVGMGLAGRRRKA